MLIVVDVISYFIYRVVRAKLGLFIEHWQKIAILSERLIKRREAAAVRTPHALFKRTFLSSILTPTVAPGPPVSASDGASIATASSTSLSSSVFNPSASIFGSFTGSPILGSHRPDGNADGGFYTSYWENEQADLSRLTMTLNALNEANAQCWRSDDCELCMGVRSGFEQVSKHMARQSDELDGRVSSKILISSFISINLLYYRPEF